MGWEAPFGSLLFPREYFLICGPSVDTSESELIFPDPHSSCFYSRETIAILAMTSNCQRSESCASFTSRGSVLGLRTAPTCMISFAVPPILVALCSWGPHWAASFFCPFEPLSELSTCSPKKARTHPLPFPFLSKSEDLFQGQLCRPELVLK